MKKKLTKLKGEIDSFTIIVGDFNTPLTIMDRTTRQKRSKETEDLTITINQLDLTDTHRPLYPITTVYTIFSSAHGTLYRIDHMLGHILSLNGF